ncbi:hypothetical protein Aph02nite_64360 [Actinoplanes philippinensis]|uniref:Uncharacterized protein n=1 Tax=Actinoplanes philippinensis TaxID=35752 RepID=A0A1I2JMD1_9ACTN|nr:hypothetical protein [Actinoplanes philippinensis]GIE80486.1 hypothetical protein Aph02nite_64360 [Actinoplanes philippinensis]SFF55268.1 hypothetical protein SAMN05421541_1137 [Actinoplanes philippinensis]
MAVRALCTELAAIRALVADGLGDIGDAGDTGQVWLRSAAARLAVFDGVITEAAGVLAGPARVIVVTVAVFAVVAGSAALAAALGIGTLIGAGVALVILLAALPPAARGIYPVIGRRRLARVPLPRSSRPPAPPATSPSRSWAAEPAAGRGPEVAAVSESGLAGVPDRLLRARVRLVSAALRQVGADSWTAPELRRAIRTDPVVRRLALADQLLCQAVDCAERHLGDLRKDSL